MYLSICIGRGQNNIIYNIMQRNKTALQHGLFCEASDVQVLLRQPGRCLNTTVVILEDVEVLMLTLQ